MVFAQSSENEADISPSRIDEIIVTARRKQENLQSVPIAVTAFQGDELEARDISDISQFGDLAPNVTLKPTASLSGASNASSFFIRGIGQLILLSQQIRALAHTKMGFILPVLSAGFWIV